MAFALTSILAPIACSSPDSTARLDAAYWLQQSAEAQALRQQAFALASARLEQARDDPEWTAALEQVGTDLSGRKPAVIVDVDETILDNTYPYAEAIEIGVPMTTERWRAWIDREAAPPAIGALDFCRAAHDAGVTVFYVTNRDERDAEATRRNLEKRGFPFLDDVDTLLCRTGDHDKGPRRAAVAADHRILLVVGDSVDDFASELAAAPDNTARRRLVRQWQEFWGTRWIVLPNPMYGAWEGRLSSDEKIEALWTGIPD